MLNPGFVPTVVIGTAGHIDHGKTALLRALTGIDADRLPEERERGMTIDVGFAHLDLPDGSSLDFVDVPGHDRLVGNMLVGVGEIDAAMLVVAADDGPRAQTIEHLELLDALGIRDGVAVVTKIDAVDPERATSVADEVRELLAATSLVGAAILATSATSGEGIAGLLEALRTLRDRVAVRRLSRPAGPTRLAIDRAFDVRGRGVVVTGSLRGGSIGVGDRLRLEPGGSVGRVRELQVHGASRERAAGGRTAINLAGIDAEMLHRGQVLTDGSGIESTDRLLVALVPVGSATRAAARTGGRAWPPADGTRARFHLGTAQVEAIIGRRGHDAGMLADGSPTAILRLDGPVASFAGDRGVLRRPSPGEVVAGFRVLDPQPARGVSRRRLAPERLDALAVAIEAGDPDAATDALVRLHGALSVARTWALAAALRAPDAASGVAAEAADHPGSLSAGAALVLADDVVAALEAEAVALVTVRAGSDPLSAGVPLAEVRSGLLRTMRRLVTLDRSAVVEAGSAIDRILDDLVARHRIARDGDRLLDQRRESGVSPELAAAMDRLEASLAVAAPPALGDAAGAAGCPPDGIRALVAAGRIVRLEPDLAWATSTYHRLAATALDLARRAPLTPASFRDATQTSRRYVLAILEDLDRRGVLERTPEGHVPGPRAPRAAMPATPATEATP